MTDQQHAAAEPGPDPGPGGRRPTTGPQDAAPSPGKDGGTASPGTGQEPPRAHGSAHAQAGANAHAGMGTGAPADQSTTGDPGGAAGESVPPPAKFRRDRQHKMLAGVCSGLARQCDMDPVIFRIVLAVLSLTGGLGLIFYGFVWLFVPREDEEENEIRKLLTGRVDGQALAAVLFALVGCGVFLTMLGNSGVLTFAVVLALLLAGAGYWSQQRGAPVPDPLAAHAVADAPPEAQAPPVPASYPSWWRDPIVKDGTHVGGTGYLWGPGTARERDLAAAINIARGTPPHRDTHTVRKPKPRGPRRTGGLIFLLALLAGGLGTSATWDDRALNTSLQTGLACALAVFGLGIAISAFLGRTGMGSIFLAVVTAGLLAGSAALPANIDTHWIRTTWAPTAMADVKPRYDLGTGVGTLDLTRLDVPKDRTLATGAEVGVGKVKVVVPPDVTVRLTIEVGIGDIQLPGDGKEDVDVAPDKRRELTLSPTDDAQGDKSGGTLDVALEVGVGQAEVTRAAS
ncbi:PspC domain-containing protein [Streptomyces poonensis]|uniref:Membrane protein n=1 Tax=Streptomyces poonensis TaxID=68255 RepID=A0A918UCM1_9ACTN|nr:PspC domain-containing protein [Streptomyces poonensis]GGY92486.1 membrane protein [Streptomyces poonensis]GLJ87684.1 membrane protein [Streptomyces poonensis]